MRESRFVIRKRIRIRSSDARIRLKNTRGAREEQARPLAKLVIHVWATCATRGGHPSAHVCHTWKVMWPFLIGHRIPSLLHLFSFHIYSKSRAEFSTTFDFLFWSYLSQINSELSDSKTKIVGIEERNKPQAISESIEVMMFLSKLISVRVSSFVGLFD